MSMIDILSPTNIMNLLTNAAFWYAKQHRILDNLQSYQSFQSPRELYELMFPLLQNEYFHSIEREKRYYEKTLFERETYPLVYKVIVNEDNDILGSGKIRLDCLRELDSMPNIQQDHQNLWKYQNFSKYVLFKEMSSYIVAVYLQNEKTKAIYSALGHYIKKKDEQYIEIPYTSKTVQIINSKNINTYDQKLKEYQDMKIQRCNSEYWDCKFYVYCQPLCSPSTYFNEAQAIQNLEASPFCDLVLNPCQQNNIREPTSFSQRVLAQRHFFLQNQNFTRNFNPHQLQAIADAVNFERKITIIKGPPGTGKTQTTIGIISIMAELLQEQGQRKGGILVLAKSNSVVNDLVRKINKHIEEENSIIFCQLQKPKNLKVVRIGRAELCEEDIEKFSLEIRSQNFFFCIKYKAETKALEDSIITLEVKRKLKRLGLIYELDGPLINQEYFTLFGLLEFIDQVNQKTQNLAVLLPLGNYYSALSKFFKNRKKEYSEIEQAFLTQCNIVVSTLNSCSHECLEQYFENVAFRMCIVDEAPTALEPSLLIPFVKYPTIEKAVLLGDTRQLNPITVANESKDYRFNRSMFERLAKSLKENSFKLIYQYRQMPNLAEITSLMFYKGLLQNGIVNMQLPDYLKDKVSLKRNRLFFNTPSQTEDDQETSKKNNLECQAILKLVLYLLNDNPHLKQKITIISAYRAQRDNLEEAFKEKKIESFVELDTVDSFQGKENDVIILSLVRSNEKTGFLSDKKRTNVALSRARFCQFIFGTKKTMQRNLYNWNKVIKLMERENEIINYNAQVLANHSFFQSQLTQNVQVQNRNLIMIITQNDDQN